MLKKIKVENLKPGMFIVDVTMSWSQVLSLDRTMYIKDKQVPELLLKSGFKEIFIETTKTKKIRLKEPQTFEKAVEPSALQRELEKAESIRNEAHTVITSIMSDVRNGKKIVINDVNQVVEKVVDSILRNHHAIVGLAKMQQKNRYIFEHAVSSCTLMVAFANSLGFDTVKQKELGVGAMLHDIGMMNISTQILNKPGRLTLVEQNQLRKHVGFGVNILKSTPGISESELLMASQHHERFDGSGYPKGLKGDEISLVGQMISIIDVYDASTTNRGYKKGIAPSLALVDILERSNKDFNGELVQKFIQSLGIYPFGTLVRLKNGLIGVVIDVKSTDLLHPTIRIIFNSQQGRMITPYDINLQEYKDNTNYKIAGVELKEKLFLKADDLTRIIGLKSYHPEMS